MGDRLMKGRKEDEFVNTVKIRSITERRWRSEYAADQGSACRDIRRSDGGAKRARLQLVRCALQYARCPISDGDSQRGDQGKWGVLVDLQTDLLQHGRSIYTIYGKIS